MTLEVRLLRRLFAEDHRVRYRVVREQERALATTSMPNPATQTRKARRGPANPPGPPEPFGVGLT